MKASFGIVAVVLASSLRAGIAESSNHVEKKEGSGISPALDPKSDKEFFGKGKDYVYDKRPKVDVLHFKHPYPAVQDSEDFDSDYIKDENSDNGYWKAQTEYDRLRHKLLKEKSDVAKAESAKDKAEQELQDALRREKEARKKHEENLHHPTSKPKAAETPKGQSSGGAGGDSVKKVGPAPGGMASPGDVKIATGEAQKAMDALEECKKQLAEAREKLKKLMEELAEARRLQRETEAALGEADAHHKEVAAGQKKLDNSVKDEYAEYMEAREAYLKQQALVAKMELEIKEAAAKVKAMRDAEDRSPHLEDGGVVPSEDHKSAAHKLAFNLGAFTLVLSMAAARVVL